MKKKLFFIGATISLLVPAHPDVPVLFAAILIYVLLQRKWRIQLKISAGK